MRIEAAFRLSVLLAAAGLIAGATPGPSASPAAGTGSRPRCIFEDNYSPFAEPCAPFTNAGVRVRTVLPNRAFGTAAPALDIGVVDDGSVLVQTERDGLYRVVHGRLQVLWRPSPRCGPAAHFGFAFVNSFDDELLLKLSSLVQVPRTRLFTSRPDGAAAVRADGSLAFRLLLDYDSVAQDASGVVWLLKGRYQDQTLYAYFPRTRIQAAVAFPKGVYSMFRSPNGHVYVSNFDGLFELDSQPTARARMVHGPIRSEYWPVQGVGPDESVRTSRSGSRPRRR